LIHAPSDHQSYKSPEFQRGPLPLSDAEGSVAGLMDFKSILKTEEATSKDLLSQATEKALLGIIPGGDSLLKKFKLPF